MSREFGSYHSGYFSSQIDTAAADCLSGKDELTRLWGSFFEEFSPVAYAVATSEAGDSGPGEPIIETIKAIGSLKAKLAAIEAYTKVYAEVALLAVREALKARPGVPKS